MNDQITTALSQAQGFINKAEYDAVIRDVEEKKIAPEVRKDIDGKRYVQWVKDYNNESPAHERP